MQTLHILIALIVVVIFLTISYWEDSGPLVKTTIALASFGIVALIVMFKEDLYFNNMPENISENEMFETTRIPTNDTKYINVDDNYSKYGNISEMNDINPLGQRNVDFEFEESDDIDNSDLIEDAIQRSSSTFQPLNVGGVTPLTSAEKSHFRLAQPATRGIAGLDYSVPIEEAGVNADANLARKQHHRSSMNKRAIDGTVRSTRNKFNKYFQNELDENEEREWWSTDPGIDIDW